MYMTQEVYFLLDKKPVLLASVYIIECSTVYSTVYSTLYIIWHSIVYIKVYIIVYSLVCNTL